MFWSLMVVCGLPSTAAASADDDGGGVGESLDPDRKPDAPAPDVAAPQRAKAYAGVGSGVAYASQGVAELGGSLGFSASPGLASRRTWSPRRARRSSTSRTPSTPRSATP